MKYGLKERYTRDFLSIIGKFQDVDKVVLFGSRAMEKHKKTSDVDIALFGEKVNAGLIDDAEGWLNAVQKRNIASHTYDEEVLSEGVVFVNNDYFPLVSKLYNDLKVKF